MAKWRTCLGLTTASARNFVESELVEQLLDDVNDAAPDAVLVSGDIGESQNVERYLSRFAARLPCPVYFVLGNHDFYHSSVHVVREAISRFCQDLQRLRQTLADRGDAAKEAYRVGYFAVREMHEALNRQIAAEADAQKKAALARDRGRVSYYVEMNYDEAEAFLRTGLDR